MKQSLYIITMIITGLLTGYFFITGFTPIGMLIGVLKSNSNNEIGLLITMIISMIKSIALCILFYIITKLTYNSFINYQEKNEKGQ